MKNEQEINDKILKITLIIQEKYPELLQYITEMPVTIPNILHPEISYNSLQDYYNSLDQLLKKYIESEKNNT